MNLDGFEFKRISPDYSILPFDCGDDDLNNFFKDDCRLHLKELMSVSYVIEKDNRTVAFFSISNDRITIEDISIDIGNEEKIKKRKKFWNSINRSVSNSKRSKSYPAVKVGRLGVCTNYKGKGIGTNILNYIKYWFIDNNKTGCRFITVDAYKTALNFYEKNNFKYLTSEEFEKKSDTRLMYYDLMPLSMPSDSETKSSSSNSVSESAVNTSEN